MNEFDDAVMRGRRLRYERLLAALEGVPGLDPEKILVGPTFPVRGVERPIYRYLIVARRRDQVEAPGVKHLSTQTTPEPDLNPDWELERVVDLSTAEVVYPETYLQCAGCGTILPVMNTPDGPCDACGGELIEKEDTDGDS